jgi:DNA-binding NtrC family response regulator
MFQKRQKSQGAWRSNKPYSVRKLGSQHQRKTVLIVDDDELVLRTLQRLLRDEWDIYTARSAAEATVMLKERTFDAVLTDYEMPGENGIWLLREVMRSSPTTHRVLCSGIGPDGLPEYITSGLVVCFVAKPSTRADLLSALTPSSVHAERAGHHFGMEL